MQQPEFNLFCSLQWDQILKVTNYSRKPPLTEGETTVHKRPLCCVFARAKFICTSGPGKICSAMCTTVFTLHSPAWEHITAPTLPSSLPAQILAFLQKVAPTNMRREHRLESLHNQDALRDQDRGTLSFTYTPDLDLDFKSLYRNNSRSSLSVGQEVFLQRWAELLQQQLYSCYNLHVTANTVLHKDQQHPKHNSQFKYSQINSE